MPNRNLCIAAVLIAEAVVMVLAFATHSAFGFMPWRTIAILLTIATLAVIRALTGSGSSRRSGGSRFM